MLFSSLLGSFGFKSEVVRAVINSCILKVHNKCLHLGIFTWVASYLGCFSLQTIVKFAGDS